MSRNKMPQGNNDEDAGCGRRVPFSGENALNDPLPDEPIALDPKIQEQLGRIFRTYCDDLIRQPIPEKFTVLLARLEAKQREPK